MNKIERIKTALSGGEVDRPPISFWRHFPDIDHRGDLLAPRLIEFARRYDLDFIKVMPSGLYPVMDWGCRITRNDNAYDVPKVVEYGVLSREDWKTLPRVDVTEGAWGEQLKTLDILKSEVGRELPYIETVFSPLTTAVKLAGPERVMADLRDNPSYLHQGLETITQATVSFVQEAFKRGVSGVFFATQNATPERMTYKEYEEFGGRYDLETLSHLPSSSYFNILHIHGDRIFFKELSDYPVQALNWHDRRAYPSLMEARGLTDKVLLGGIDERNATALSRSEMVSQLADALVQTEGRKLILAPGCVLPTTVTDDQLGALIDSLGQAWGS